MHFAPETLKTFSLLKKFTESTVTRDAVAPGNLPGITDIAWHTFLIPFLSIITRWINIHSKFNPLNLH